MTDKKITELPELTQPNFADEDVIYIIDASEPDLTADKKTTMAQLRAEFVGVTDHGNLTGLSDDDHTQYIKVGGRAGDKLVAYTTATGAGLSTSQGYILNQPTDPIAESYGTVSSISTDNYTTSNAQNIKGMSAIVAHTTNFNLTGETTASQGTILVTSSGIIAEGKSFNSRLNMLSAGAVTDYKHYATEISNAGGGTLTNVYGLYMDSLSFDAAVNKYSLYCTDATAIMKHSGKIQAPEIEDATSITLDAPLVNVNSKISITETNVDNDLRQITSPSLTNKGIGFKNNNDDTNFEIRFTAGSGESMNLTKNGLELFTQVKAEQGSASAPAITYRNDINTGFYFPVADEMATSCGGIEVARFSNIGLDVRQGVIKANQVYGEVYQYNESGTNIVVTTAGTYYPWITAVNGHTIGGTYLTFRDDAAGDGFDVGTDGAGIYKADIQLSFSGTASRTFTGKLFINGIAQDKVSFRRTLGVGGDVGNVSFGGLITLAASDFVDLRFTAGSNSSTLTVQAINFTLVRVGR